MPATIHDEFAVRRPANKGSLPSEPIRHNSTTESQYAAIARVGEYLLSIRPYSATSVKVRGSHYYNKTGDQSAIREAFAPLSLPHRTSPSAYALVEARYGKSIADTVADFLKPFADKHNLSLRKMVSYYTELFPNNAYQSGRIEARNPPMRPAEKPAEDVVEGDAPAVKAKAPVKAPAKNTAPKVAAKVKPKTKPKVKAKAKVAAKPKVAKPAPLTVGYIATRLKMTPQAVRAQLKALKVRKPGPTYAFKDRETANKVADRIKVRVRAAVAEAKAKARAKAKKLAA